MHTFNSENKTEIYRCVSYSMHKKDRLKIKVKMSIKKMTLSNEL